MTLKICAPKSSKFVVLLLALTTSVSLTACSTLSDDAKAWTALGRAPDPREAEVVTNDMANPPPDIPPHLVKCIEKKAPAGKTANDKVTNELKTADERRFCMKAILTWYKELQRAEKERGQKRASADPPPIKP